MWPKIYQDYPPDTPLKKERVEPGRGLVGCEMCELNGWGEAQHLKRNKKRGLFDRKAEAKE